MRRGILQVYESNLGFIVRRARERVFGYLGSVLSINETVRRVAADERVPLADIRGRLEREGLEHNDPYLLRLLYDYCHLSADGMWLAMDKLERTLRATDYLPAGSAPDGTP